MNRNASGRVSIPLLIAVVCLVVTGLVIANARTEDEVKAGKEWLYAFGEGNLDRITELSFMDGLTPEQKRAEWKKTLDRAKYYTYVWNVKRSVKTTDTEATITLGFWRNATKGGSYEEKYELPLRKVDGKWLVDVRGISRSMFPALPR